MFRHRAGLEMSKLGLLLLMVVALLLSAFCANRWADSLVLSIYSYRTPVKGTPPPTQDVTSSITSQVVLVVIDGLRQDATLGMPAFSSLRRSGASALVVYPPPSTTETAWTTIVTGAGPETNNAPLVDRPTELIQTTRLDTVFASASRASLKTGIVGLRGWQRLVPASDLFLHAYVEPASDAADLRTTEEALVFLREFEPALLLVHLSQLAEIGAQNGATGAEYAAAALRCDEYLSRIASAMDLRKSVLIVVSSHGLLDDGTHGGAEVAPRLAPFLMAGEGVAAGSYRAISAMDVAPLISALLGSPVPAHALGRIPTQMLKMSDEAAASKLLALASQRLRIGNIYLASIGRGAISKTAEGDYLTAQSSILVGNLTSAAELARLSVQQADLEIVRGRTAKLRAERDRRLPITLAVLVAPLLVLWLRRSGRSLWLLLVSLVSVQLYHVLYLWLGGTYSFSQIPPGELAAQLTPTLRQAIVALGIGALLAMRGLWRERSAFEIAKQTLGMALMSVVLVSGGIALCTWWSGVRFSWYIPNLTVAFVQYSLLIQTMWFSLVGALLPLPVVLLHGAVARVRKLWARHRVHSLPNSLQEA